MQDTLNGVIVRTLEAIGWELAHVRRPENPDNPELASFAAQVTALLEEAQHPDGYLNSYFQVSGEPRYTRLAWSHEMYCAGHLIQAAVDMVTAKTCLTGGNGSRHATEGFGDRFELPPDRAYNETCAAIASFQWSWRLLLATGDAKYADHMERVLYNGFGAAIATGGQRFFYVNPLQRREDHVEKDDPGRRRVWFNCACCPPNIMRLVASLEHYLATESGDTLHVHQYTGSRLAGAGLDLKVTTDYPWSGAVYLRVLTAPQAGRGLALRVPAWSATRISLNHDPERTEVSPGYHVLHRSWRPDDLVTLHLDVTPRWTYPDRRVDAVRGCVAIERGPLVYCFEQADQLGGARLDDLAIHPGGVLRERPVTLTGVGRTIEVTARGVRLPTAPPVPGTPPQVTTSTASFGPTDPLTSEVTAIAIPYFQWDNRDGGPMRVWMPLC